MKFQLEHVDCDLCGSARYETRYRKSDLTQKTIPFPFPVVRCMDCGLVYVNPRPTIESMKAFYTKEYYPRIQGMAPPDRFDIETAFLPPLSKERILDIGCATGEFLMHLHSKYPGIEIHGSDLYCDAPPFSQIHFIPRALPDCGYEDDFFDIVTAWAVVEHLHQPSVYFREVSRILKKDGKFIFLVTNSESLYGKTGFREDIPRHLYHFSERTLRQYAQGNNFQLNKITYDDRIWDGRGKGTLQNFLQGAVGIKWEDRFWGTTLKLQRYAGHLGFLLDQIIFTAHWERLLKCSGIIVVEFQKL